MVDLSAVPRDGTSEGKRRRRLAVSTAQRIFTSYYDHLRNYTQIFRALYLQSCSTCSAEKLCWTHYLIFGASVIIYLVFLTRTGLMMNVASHQLSRNGQYCGRRWRLMLHELRSELETYEDASGIGNGGRVIREKSSKRIEELYRELALIHPDVEVRRQMAKDAEEWGSADDTAKLQMLHPLRKGLGTLLAAPFVVAGTVLYGAGQLLVGLADVLTLGYFRG